jgi:hypothetical protein
LHGIELMLEVKGEPAIRGQDDTSGRKTIQQIRLHAARAASAAASCRSLRCG